MARRRRERDWVLARAANEAAATHALFLLGEADRAQRRLRRASRTGPARQGDETLHDFRVALRRVRSHLRAYRKQLPLAKKPRKRLRDLARRTNPARDAEVALAWLSAEYAALDAGERADAQSFIASVADEVERAHRGLADELVAAWPPLARPLRRQLHGCIKDHRRGRVKGQHSFGRTTASLVDKRARRLEKALRRIGSRTDACAIHRARIQAKRLRYLLEPWRGAVAPAGELVERLRRLQDVTGDLHDAQLLGERLQDALGRAPDGAFATRPGLARLAARLDAYQDTCFATAAREHLGTAIDTLVDDARRVAAIIAPWPPPGVEGQARSS